jgi:alcohol oxidase
LNLDSSTSELTSYSQSLSLLIAISSPADLVILRWAYKHLREIARRMEFYRGELQVGHPNFAQGSQAATHAANTPVEISAPKIVYSKEDDDAIDEYHRRTGLYS